MKKGRKLRDIPGVKTALAVATKLHLRKPKGLQGVPPEALTMDAAASPEVEEAILSSALGAMKKLTDKELKTNPAYKDPGKPAVGDTVFIPFIGSAAEEAGCSRDVKTAFTLEEYDRLNKKVKKAGPKTCGMCFGWGTVGEKKCPRCKGKGAV